MNRYSWRFCDVLNTSITNKKENLTWMYVKNSPGKISYTISWSNKNYFIWTSFFSPFRQRFGNNRWTPATIYLYFDRFIRKHLKKVFLIGKHHSESNRWYSVFCFLFSWTHIKVQDQIFPETYKFSLDTNLFSF